MAEKDDEMTLSAKTPWGSLLTSKGAQLLVEGFVDDIFRLRQQIKQLEKKNKPSNINKPQFTNSILETNKKFKTEILELNEKVNQLDQRISELDDKFTRFTSRALTLLNQLSNYIKK